MTTGDSYHQDRQIETKTTPDLGLRLQKKPPEIRPEEDSPPVKSTQEMGREVGLGGGGSFLNKLQKCVDGPAKGSIKESGWKINMERKKILKRSLEKNEKQPH